jgi:hypothetical protein
MGCYPAIWCLILGLVPRIKYVWCLCIYWPTAPRFRHCMELHVGMVGEIGVFFTSLPATMGPTRIAIRWSKIYQASTFCVRPILALPKMLYIYIMDALTRQRQERRINKRINNYLNGAISF